MRLLIIKLIVGVVVALLGEANRVSGNQVDGGQHSRLRWLRPEVKPHEGIARVVDVGQRTVRSSRLRNLKDDDSDEDNSNENSSDNSDDKRDDDCAMSLAGDDDDCAMSLAGDDHKKDDDDCELSAAGGDDSSDEDCALSAAGEDSDDDCAMSAAGEDEDCDDDCDLVMPDDDCVVLMPDDDCRDGPGSSMVSNGVSTSNMNFTSLTGTDNKPATVRPS